MSQPKEESSAGCIFCTVRSEHSHTDSGKIGSGIILEKVGGKGEEYSWNGLKLKLVRIFVKNACLLCLSPF
jgi:hypothetical protein